LYSLGPKIHLSQTRSMVWFIERSLSLPFSLFFHHLSLSLTAFFILRSVTMMSIEKGKKKERKRDPFTKCFQIASFSSGPIMLLYSSLDSAYIIWWSIAVRKKAKHMIGFRFIEAQAVRLACQPVDVTRYISLIINCVYLMWCHRLVYSITFDRQSEDVVIGHNLKICLTSYICIA